MFHPTNAGHRIMADGLINLIKIADGSLGMEAAYFSGKIKAEGDLGKALLLKSLTAKKAKKAAEKKPAAKKAAAPKKAAKKTTRRSSKKAAPAAEAPAAEEAPKAE